MAGGVDESFLHTASASQVVSGLRLADAPSGWILGAQLAVRSGAAAGAVIRLSGVEGDLAIVEPGQDEVLAALAVGDEVVLDNSSFLAAQTYHRHQVPGAEYAVWDQFRDADGAPRLPQRPMLLGPLMTQGASGTVPSGRITGKMIVVACLLDREAFPWQADWYRVAGRRAPGRCGIGDRFRLWYVDNALHGDDDPQEFPARSVAYVGALETALRQLAAWVEDGIEPSPTTVVRDRGRAGRRCPRRPPSDGGVQPVATLTVNGAASATVRVGEPVTVRVEAEAPGDGVIVELLEVETDAAAPSGSESRSPSTRRVAWSSRSTRIFDEPGTHFLAVRVAAQTAGDASDPHARVRNIVRARVTVTD